ncbi:hypothetical protein NE237_022906 [Protea cynaroides]|uniref:Uncharacterized protein n=1 Tax=Protea cynaroides TaxID=273540 RepID=A0A9Q0HFB4_9MAGN|nr:hypothetical protein NE237_022906 [Protea cynaroides]
MDSILEVPVGPTSDHGVTIHKTILVEDAQHVLTNGYQYSLVDSAQSSVQDDQVLVESALNNGRLVHYDSVPTNRTDIEPHMDTTERIPRSICAASSGDSIFTESRVDITSTGLQQMMNGDFVTCPIEVHIDAHVQSTPDITEISLYYPKQPGESGIFMGT